MLCNCWPWTPTLLLAKTSSRAVCCNCSRVKAQQLGGCLSALQTSPLRAANRCRYMADRSAVSATSPAAALMSAVQTSSNLWQRLESVYEAAVASGALFKTDSTDQFIEDGGIEFVVRVAALLREKAKTKKQQTAAYAAVGRCNVIMLSTSNRY